jgi:WW domain
LQLKVETYPFAKIAKWVVSRDGKIFAFNLDDEKIIYIATELAPVIERCVERNVEEMVRFKQSQNDEEKWSPPRESSGPGVAGVAELVKKETRPKPVYATVPSAERQAAMLVTLGLKEGASGGPSGAKPDKAKTNAGLPPYWHELKDAEGDAFYFHELTGETTWTKPKPLPLPPNWTTGVDSDGDTYWVNVVTGESSWFPPDAEKEKKKLAEGLPAGWSVHYDSEGDPFYRNDKDGKTQWERPT